MQDRNIDSRSSFIFLLKVWLFLVFVFIFTVLWYETIRYRLVIKYWNRGNIAIIVVYSIEMLVSSVLLDSLNIEKKRVGELFYLQFFWIIAVNIFTYIQLSLIGNWRILTNYTPVFANFDVIAILITLELLISFVWDFFMKKIIIRIIPPTNVILIQNEHLAKELSENISKRNDIFKIEKILEIHGDIDLAKREIDKYRAVVLSDMPIEIRNELLKYCFENKYYCYFTHRISDILIYNASIIELFDTPLYSLNVGEISIYNRIVKRIFDIAISLTAIIIFIPIMIVIAIAIKAYDGGPIFYTQLRLTKNEREYKIIKFRSMIVDSENGHALLTKKNDSRVTPIGKIIRRLHFDEIPQLFNVLKGDMSIVGPRPERKELIEQYKKEVPEFGYRLKVKAGMTGYAQVYGKYNTSPYNKLKMDIKYIEDYSLLLDLKLCFLTFRILFQKEKSEGFENE